MTEDQESKESDSGGKLFSNKSKDKKSKLQKPFTKVIIRRLPPTMSEETFLEQVSPIPEYDYFNFAKPDSTLSSYARAYINFVNVDEIYLFRDKFDGYIFLDDKGIEYVSIVEYAPFQRIPKKKKKKDPKCNTIESDPVYQEFLESLNEQDTETQPKLEYSYPINDANDKKTVSTPLLDYLAARKLDKRNRDERRRKENDKRKLRILKSKDGSLKKNIQLDEDKCEDGSISWFSSNRINHKKSKHELKSHSFEDLFISKEKDWDVQFPALSTKPYNTFTLSSGKFCNLFANNEKSAGDNTEHRCFEEEDDIEIKKGKPLEWDYKSKKDDYSRSPEDKDSGMQELKNYRDQRKAALEKKKCVSPSKLDEEDDKGRSKDKVKESPREVKTKKYSESRRERLKQLEALKDKEDDSGTNEKAEVKISKSMNHDDIKPFTQLPHIKTDDLIKVMEEMDRKLKLEESDAKSKENLKSSDQVEARVATKVRRNSCEEVESAKDDYEFKRQNSLDDSSREDSVEKDKDGERRSEKRIRNKDRPSLVIYQPGMGRFSKQRLAKEKDTTAKVNDSEKRDT